MGVLRCWKLLPGGMAPLTPPEASTPGEALVETNLRPGPLSDQALMGFNKGSLLQELRMVP